MTSKKLDAVPFQRKVLEIVDRTPGSGHASAFAFTLGAWDREVTLKGGDGEVFQLVFTPDAGPGIYEVEIVVSSDAPVGEVRIPVTGEFR